MGSLSSLARLDGVAQAELVQRGELRPEELVDACAERLAALDPTLRSAPVVDLGHFGPLVPREEVMRRMGEAVGYTPIHNIAGCPAMSVPLHWSEEGLPIGTHLAAAPGQDALLLGLAYELEAARPWRDRWPPLSIPALFD